MNGREVLLHIAHLFTLLLGPIRGGGRVHLGLLFVVPVGFEDIRTC